MTDNQDDAQIPSIQILPAEYSINSAEIMGEFLLQDYWKPYPQDWEVSSSLLDESSRNAVSNHLSSEDGAPTGEDHGSLQRQSDTVYSTASPSAHALNGGDILSLGANQNEFDFSSTILLSRDSRARSSSLKIPPSHRRDIGHRISRSDFSDQSHNDFILGQASHMLNLRHNDLAGPLNEMRLSGSLPSQGAAIKSHYPSTSREEYHNHNHAEPDASISLPFHYGVTTPLLSKDSSLQAIDFNAQIISPIPSKQHTTLSTFPFNPNQSASHAQCSSASHPLGRYNTDLGGFGSSHVQSYDDGNNRGRPLHSAQRVNGRHSPYRPNAERPRSQDYRLGMSRSSFYSMQPHSRSEAFLTDGRASLQLSERPEVHIDAYGVNDNGEGGYPFLPLRMPASSQDQVSAWPSNVPFHEGPDTRSNVQPAPSTPRVSAASETQSHVTYFDEQAAGSSRGQFRLQVTTDRMDNAARNRRRIRPDEVLYVCPIRGCNKDFTAKHNLRNHLNSHNGIRDYPCAWCDKWFGTLHVQKRHEEKCPENPNRLEDKAGR